ncbi:transporter substrate-binding domain-containing protein [Sporolactobacillus kofuensis]|uniref:Transporter substrate-binding domain-containing protein n=1 Tax=Sporolactobacillus kofuensis TaxID=269672 RepID=A0ABW1WEB8_9BACL|nr:transporter substrate-binding domain-containing protein [Sporolactobacillus kofuensis]MCO7175720.1 transporter substrate-binding domain-containing protein [Sporolactobacillus kofuensis]
MKKLDKIIIGIVAVVVIVFAGIYFIGNHGSNKAQSSGKASSNKPTVIKVAYATTNFPITYQNSKKQGDGYDVAVMREVDKLLPQYKFDYVGTSDDDVLIGVKSDKYQVGVKNVFYTADRAKTYLYPKNYLGVSDSGFVVRTKDKDKFGGLAKLANNKGKLVPIAPQNGQYAVIADYNKTHNPKIDLGSADTFVVSDALKWVNEGRYDAFFAIRPMYEANVEKKNGANADLKGKLTYVTLGGIKTYPLFNKDQKALAAAYDKAIKKVIDSGKAAQLSEKYFGQDNFKLLNKPFK